MLHWALLPLCALACAIGYRIRGGALAGTRFQTPGQVSRLIFALTAAMTALAGGAVWWHAALLVPAFWACTTVPLFNSIDLGANEGSFWGDFSLLAARGVLAVILAAGALWWLAYPCWWVLLASGPLMAPSYLFGRQIKLAAPGLGSAVDFPPRGEAIFGLYVGLGTFLAVAL